MKTVDTSGGTKRSDSGKVVFGHLSNRGLWILLQIITRHQRKFLFQVLILLLWHQIMNFLLKDKKEALQAGFDALSKLTDGNVNVTIENTSKNTSVFSDVKGIELFTINSKHPAGNVGTQIHQINPINKGEIVWTINALDVARIGSLFLTGKVDFSKTIALTGSEVETPSYYTVTSGASLTNLVDKKITSDNVRYISGNVLVGTNVGKDGYLGFYDNQVTVIPEGDHYKVSFTEGCVSSRV